MAKEKEHIRTTRAFGVFDLLSSFHSKAATHYVRGLPDWVCIAIEQDKQRVREREGTYSYSASRRALWLRRESVSDQGTQSEGGRARTYAVTIRSRCRKSHNRAD